MTSVLRSPAKAASRARRRAAAHVKERPDPDDFDAIRNTVPATALGQGSPLSLPDGDVRARTVLPAQRLRARLSADAQPSSEARLGSRTPLGPHPPPAARQAAAPPEEQIVISPEVISPELVLVCPELRALALQLLPERDPNGLLLKPALEPLNVPMPTVSRLEPNLGAANPTQQKTESLRLPRIERTPALPVSQTSPKQRLKLIVAALAYTCQRAVGMIIEVTAFVAVLAGVLFLIQIIRF